MTRMNTPARALTKTVLSLSALALLITGAVLYAGPLNPPAGPVASTYKTLTEVEPRIAVSAANTPGDANSLFKITQPGSYYLTGNVVGVAGRHGIEIGNGSVVLDLNGFAVINSGIGLDGVTTDGLAQVSITVKNGVVSAWGNGGIDLEGTGHLIEHIHARVNAHEGIAVGLNAVVANCQASGNLNTGIGVSNGSTVSHCAAHQNAANGIVASNGSTVSNCAASENAADGIVASVGSTVSNCTAYLNTGDGISANGGSSVSNCAAYDNTGNGINTDNGSVANGSTVTGCVVRVNVLNGIVCRSACLVRDNVASSNGNGGDGANIHATGTDNRIEGNSCIGADRGIDVDGTGNIIIRNTCSGNTVNWVIVAGNAHGPIVVTPAGAGVNGNAAAAALGSTDPNANFTY